MRNSGRFSGREFPTQSNRQCARDARRHGVCAHARKGEARDGMRRAGLEAVQLRHDCQLTSEEYVKQKAWRSASLLRCPKHPAGGCGFARHTTYARVKPSGMHIARWYCPEAHVTFSLLPDCLASRLSSTLGEVERVADAVERRAGSFEAVAEQLRPDIEVQGAVRWVRRRVVAAALALRALKGLRPDLFGKVAPTLGAVRAALGVDAVLAAVRALAGAQLAFVPPYVGFGARCAGGKAGRGPRQHEAGADSS